MTAIVIRFDKPVPASTAAQQLDLAKIQPVLVSNEFGEILGEAYPERGVLFSFAGADAPGKASMKVSHIVLEAIGAEAFLLVARKSNHSISVLLRDNKKVAASKPTSK